MSACPAVKQQSVIAKKNFFNFNEKSAKNKSNQEPPKAFQHYCFPITLSAFSHSNFRCVFSPSHQEKIVFLAKRPLSRPSFDSFWPHKMLSTETWDFTLWFTFCSSYLFVSIFMCFLSGECHEISMSFEPEPGQSQSLCTECVYVMCKAERGLALCKIDATKCLVNLRQKGNFLLQFT